MRMQNQQERDEGSVSAVMERLWDGEACPTICALRSLVLGFRHYTGLKRGEEVQGPIREG